MNWVKRLLSSEPAGRREPAACAYVWGAFADPDGECLDCGRPVREHAQDPVRRADVAEMAEQRAPHNPRGVSVILSGEEERQKTATELIRAAGDSMPALAVALTTIAQRFEDSVRNADTLNRTLGEFKEQVVGPFREELRFLRFNLGDKVNQTTTNMEVMVDKLEKLITANLRSQGFSDEKILEFRVENGLDRPPSGPELEAHVAEHQELLAQVAALTAQNQRLLAQLSAKHVEWPEDGGNWVYHEGCQCERCRVQARGNAMTAEAEGAARSQFERVAGPVERTPKKKRRGS
jgi:hypothetical protein